MQIQELGRGAWLAIPILAMTYPNSARGFSLLETLIALVLVGLSMTALLVAFVASGQFGVLSRRQATALALASSIAGQLNYAPYADARLVNNNVQNDTNFADPDGLFAQPTLPTGNDAPDSTMPVQNVGNESYEVYVNVVPRMGDGNWDPTTLEMGRSFAVIVRYRVGRGVDGSGGRFMRAVSLGYHYNPAAVGTGTIPLPL